MNCYQSAALIQIQIFTKT